MAQYAELREVSTFGGVMGVSTFGVSGTMRHLGNVAFRAVKRGLAGRKQIRLFCRFFANGNGDWKGRTLEGGQNQNCFCFSLVSGVKFFATPRKRRGTFEPEKRYRFFSK